MRDECRFNGARGHFVARVHERIGPDVDGDQLFDEIKAALEAGDDDFVRFKANQGRGRAVYRVIIAGSNWFIAASKRSCLPLTVLPREHWLYKPRHNRHEEAGVARHKKLKRPPSKAWIRHKRERAR